MFTMTHFESSLVTVKRAADEGSYELARKFNTLLREEGLNSVDKWRLEQTTYGSTVASHCELMYVKQKDKAYRRVFLIEFRPDGYCDFSLVIEGRHLVFKMLCSVEFALNAYIAYSGTKPLFESTGYAKGLPQNAWFNYDPLPFDEPFTATQSNDPDEEGFVKPMYPARVKSTA